MLLGGSPSWRQRGRPQPIDEAEDFSEQFPRHRHLGLFADAAFAIDGSKFKAVNNRDHNFTRAKMQRRMAQIEDSVERYLHQLDSADRQEPSLALATKTARLTEKVAKLRQGDATSEGT